MVPSTHSKTSDRKIQKILIAAFLFFQICMASPSNREETEVSEQHRKPGFCYFGRVQSCCYGWRNVNGECQPVCIKPCINGICIGPDKCSCTEGYTGEQCNEDINECGRPSRPCSHSCMNTPGSFRCYCDPGYTLDADGKSCNRPEKPDCTRLHCQLGCQIGSNGALICSCPPGLQLALDKRTCKDVDECKGAFSACSERQTCRNTFGSYACVCRSGYMLGILGNSVTCRDEDECVTGRHRCSRHAQCVNTDGSYTCQCENDYAGDGFSCWKRKSGRSQNGMYFQYKLSKRSRTTDTG
ncbi:nephronectin [Pangasianodon hypophthalmus]|uniref:nephronectin n=1 Tax=Pangasianodon hypophthalmus TaxID=310915 RepID=UPI00230706E2|nr:nephronectin [Pangasianodon hypophthalmus]